MIRAGLGAATVLPTASRRCVVRFCSLARAANTLQAVLVTAPAPEPLRSQLRNLSTGKLIDACLRLRPATNSLHNPVQAAKLSLHSIATRARALDAEAEARELKRQLDALTAAAPATSAILASVPTPCRHC